MNFLSKIILITFLNLPLIACAQTKKVNCSENAQCYYQIAQEEYRIKKKYDAEIIQSLEKSAKLGLDAAQYKLGLIYSDRTSNFYDYQNSKFWLSKQNEKNYNAAYFLAQLIYERGNLISADYDEIEKNLLIAIKGNNLDAFRDLSMLYFYAPEKHKNLDKAYKYSLLASEKNIPEAQYILGTLYDFGKGPVKKNYKQAFYWYSLSSIKKNAPALNNLGVLYAKGQGVEQDEEKAFKYFEESYNLGNSDALINLGEAYLKGVGVKQNVSLAKKYFNKALKNGDLKAKAYLSRIED
ncbi:sel1 repeat family protein [Acinetobacter wuhouensis]|uniref:tetratricopeptide repeat protein n=1 Tax=Acinetobacter wuhouensis TaxID=1879050 RepID=UPI000839FA92|nr:tetratricopeptide repeat protein [Acinetobacter wuhouensis]AXQ22870.1 sel1 repeat family protein [Acinetobacter wuhouensis]